jgi:hypothetical protein
MIDAAVAVIHRSLTGAVQTAIRRREPPVRTARSERRPDSVTSRGRAYSDMSRVVNDFRGVYTVAGSDDGRLR